MIVLWLIFFILLVQLFFVIWNLIVFYRTRKITKSPGQENTPLISVLIPARNEEKNIEEVIRSVMNQTSLPLECLVLDDHSTDETSTILTRLVGEFPLLKMIKGKQLKKGWLGKSYACHQLTKQAKGDWYLFLDADARLEKNALEELIPYLNQQQTGIISGFPKQVVGTLAEKLVVPMMMVVIMFHLPIKFITYSADPKFSAAHGGFIAFEKHSYRESGGHEAIKTSIIDDMALFKRQKKLGYPATLLKVDDWVSMRMYDSFKSVYYGYQKNMFAGVGRRASILITVMFYYFALFILPFFFMSQDNLLLIALIYFTGVFTKMLIDVTNKISVWISLMMPLSVILFIFIGFVSMLKSLTGKGYEWKGRRYQ